MLPSRRYVSLFFLLFLLVPMLPILKTYGATATIAVNPPVSNVTSGDTFNINVNVSNIANFTCWELKLYFLKGILNCTAAIEGPFLKTGGGTFYNKTITNNFNATHGQLSAYSTLLGSTSVAGNGTILTVTFKAVGGGNTPIHMADIKLGDEKIPPHDIPFTAVDGVANVASVGVHDVAITAVTPLKTVVGQGYPCAINVTAENQGDSTESFNVTLKADMIVVETKNITIVGGRSAIITFTWWIYLARKTYAISAIATPVPGETDVADNTFVDGNIYVGTPGDVDGNHIVNMLDLYNVALSFGKTAPYATPQIANCDIDGNGIVNMLDLYIAATHFGQADP